MKPTNKISVNKGVIVSGTGSIHAKQFVGGENANASQIILSSNYQAVENLRLEIEKLQMRIKDNSGLLHNSSELLDATSTVHSELSKEKPNKLTMLSLLSGIATGSKSISAIVDLASTIKTAIESMS